LTGVGTSGGAASVINAFATGKGAAFGLGWHVACLADPARAWNVTSNGRRLPSHEARLAIATAKAAGAQTPLQLRIRSEIPSRKGLKSSSAVGVAVARSVLDLEGRAMSPPRLLKVVAGAALQSGTSLTGAFDDAAACLLGGLVLCDNRRRRIIDQRTLPKDHVAALSIPKTTRATAEFELSTFRPFAPLVEEAWDALLQGHLREAMLANALAYSPPLGHRLSFTLQALALGATAAGLSGKGPAEVAIVPLDLVARFRRHDRRLRFIPLGGRS
jgi:shikimate kinase